MYKPAIGLTILLLSAAAWAQKADTPGAPKTANPPAVDTRTYKGTLVDASCVSNVTQAAPAANAATTTGTANRAAAGDQGCAVSASTKAFALRTKEGRILRFDDVGNERTAEALKNKKNWSAAMAAGKPITAKIAASSLDGDNVTVVTID